MKRSDRRMAHRYSPARDHVRLGWWNAKQFHTRTARLQNISTSGASMYVEGEGVPPRIVWLCLAGQDASQWLRAEVLEVTSEAAVGGTLRLRFADSCPYDVFKSAVWGGTTAASTMRKVDPPSQAARPASPLFSSCEPRPSPSMSESAPAASRVDTALHQAVAVHSQWRSLRRPSPSPPTLVQAQRQNQAIRDKLSPLSWIYRFVICSVIALMLGLMALGRFESLRWIVIILGLGR
jgi:hypothetical protein